MNKFVCKNKWFTYGSCIKGAILSIASIKLASPQNIEGFWGCEFTLSILNRIHNITAITVKIAVDILVNQPPKNKFVTNTV